MTSNKTILIADDDPGMITILTHILQMEGYNVVSESNGNDAYERAVKLQPDMLILDMFMPAMTGLEILEKLRGDDDKFSTPALLLTGSDPVDYQEKAESLGNVKFVEKPFELDNLIATVKSSFPD